MADDSLHQPAATNQKSRSPLSRKLIFGLLLGFAVFVGLILVGDIRQVGSEVRSFPWQIMPAVLGLTLWNYLLRFIKMALFPQTGKSSPYTSP